MPGARCARSLARNRKKRTSIVTTVTPVSPDIPRAMVYGLFRALPSDRLFCHCRLRIAPQAWRQRRGVRTTRLCRPPQRRSSRALLASTASHLTSVTIAKRLLRGDGMRIAIILILPGGQVKF